jgi:UDP-galactopyranose mutase
MCKYNYLIVGSGLFGAVFAYKAKICGKKVLVIDKRNHIGGNVYCENIEGINVHKYGAHIFHTSDREVWQFVNNFVSFNHFINSPIANYKGKLYNLPFNMNTFYVLWGVMNPRDAYEKIQMQKRQAGILDPRNLEEKAISIVGRDIYEILIKGYTEKQWGRKCAELPASIINRIPVRFTFDNNYFADLYQGIPIGGYNGLINGLLDEIEVKTNADFFNARKYWENIAEKIVYTGRIDEYFNYQYGKLEYRTIRFENETLNCCNYQGNAVVNYTCNEIPYTRIIEHKHFEFGEQNKTVISKEYPSEWAEGSEPFYPINDEKNNMIYNKYNTRSKKNGNVIFGGRLAEYRYYDMDKTIRSALDKFHESEGY